MSQRTTECFIISIGRSEFRIKLKIVRIGEGEGGAVVGDHASFFGSQTVHVGVSWEWEGEVSEGREFMLIVFLCFEGVVLYCVVYTVGSYGVIE